MAMSKKHYKAVAKIMQERFEVFRAYSDSRRNVPVDACKMAFAAVVSQLADVYAQDNKNFDRKLFYRECSKLTELEEALKSIDGVEF